MLTPVEKSRVLVLVADQTPSNSDAFWMNFLNQDTPVLSGIEKMAKKLNCPVIYTTINRIRRGYYTMETEILVEEPKNLPENEVQMRFMQRLEQGIKREPYLWLWSHKRWKHRHKTPNTGGNPPAK